MPELRGFLNGLFGQPLRLQARIAGFWVTVARVEIAEDAERDRLTGRMIPAEAADALARLISRADLLDSRFDLDHSEGTVRVAVHGRESGETLATRELPIAFRDAKLVVRDRRGNGYVAERVGDRVMAVFKSRRVRLTPV